MLAWTKQNTMQRAMRTVLEWPQSHATSKHYNMITNKYDPKQKNRCVCVGGCGGGGLNWFYGIPNSPSASVMAQNLKQKIYISPVSLETFNCFMPHGVCNEKNT